MSFLSARQQPGNGGFDVLPLVGGAEPFPQLAAGDVPSHLVALPAAAPSEPCWGTLEVGGGDGGHHRPSRRRRPWGYAPAAASSAVETSGTFPSHTVPWAPLESAEEVEVYELYHVALADGLISRTKEVVVDGRYDLDLLDRAVVVGVVPNDQRVRGVNFAKIQPKDSVPGEQGGGAEPAPA